MKVDLTCLRCGTEFQRERGRENSRIGRGCSGPFAPGAAPWLARVRVDRQLIYIGRFVTEEEAARAYDSAARKHFGEFARLNFSEEPS